MDVFFEQYFDFELMANEFDKVLEGFGVTVELAIISATLALVWGLVLAVLRRLPGRPAAPVRWFTIAYIDVFRGIPLLLVILLISGGVPALTFLPEELRVEGFLGFEAPFWFGVMGITLTYGAYYAEVYRAGIEAVPPGQTEAARSLGMSNATALRHVVLPQAVRKVIPPMLNDFVALMKDTSLVGVLAVGEVVKIGREVQGEFFNASALTLGAFMFVLVTVPLARLVDWQIARQQLRFQRGP
jgi:polar amino acid transport system permease protein